MKKIKCREVALKVLLDIDKNVRCNAALAAAYAKFELSDKDRSLCTELVNGVTRMRKKLDWFIAGFVDYPLEKLSGRLLNILRLGCYQKLFLTRIPEHAIVNESVELAKKYEPKASSLVNAVLRKFLANYRTLSLPDEEENPILFYALKYSFDEWLIETWFEQFSRKEMRKLCEELNQPAPITIRVNQLKVKPEELLALLSEEGVKAAPCGYSSHGLTVQKFNGPLTELPSYQDGLFSIQGESSQLISQLLAPTPGSTVFDLCCGHGGKCGHLAEILNNSGSIVAFDQSKVEIKALKETVKRLSLKNVKAVTADLTKTDEKYVNQADYVLVDAPCSGLGTLRRYADARWRKQPDTILEMAATQLQILNVAAQYLKDGGRLVFAVCTNTFAENEQVLTHFLHNNPEFELEQLHERLSVMAQKLVEEKIYFKSLPHRDDLDGFFAASLRKRKRS